jgi:hypothetical protein
MIRSMRGRGLSERIDPARTGTMTTVRRVGGTGAVVPAGTGTMTTVRAAGATDAIDPTAPAGTAPSVLPFHEPFHASRTAPLTEISPTPGPRRRP